jgi:hypothetical protein
MQELEKRKEFQETIDLFGRIFIFNDSDSLNLSLGH